MSSTHLIGVGELPDAAVLPALPDYGTRPWELGEIEVLHVNYEISSRGMLSTLPPALHPSIPPHLSWLVYRVPDGEYGPFTFAQTRIGCRIGIKPRGLLVGAVCDNPAAAAALTRGWGFRITPGKVLLRRRADQIELRVSVPGRGDVLAVDVLDPTLLAGAGVPIAPGLTFANTPDGIRLIQVDPEYVIESADRGRPTVRSFDTRAWGHRDIEPTWPISGAYLRAEVTLPGLRYVTDPSVPAGRGTTKLGVAK
jgi:hypothetical protein